MTGAKIQSGPTRCVWNPEFGIRAAVACKWQVQFGFWNPELSSRRQPAQKLDPMELGTWNPLLGDFFILPHFLMESGIRNPALSGTEIYFECIGIQN